MKIVILAGGYGTRLSEYTESVPKPMVKIGDKPILLHIMNLYASYGHKDFYLALGYKAEVIKEYFLNYRGLNSDFSIDLSTGVIEKQEGNSVDWRVTLTQTGLNTMTGGRLKRLAAHLRNETFLLTYGDGLSNVNIDALVDFHRSHGKMITVTAVHPAARFGELNIDDQGHVKNFKEKPQMGGGWINGGFFVIEPEFLDLIDNDSSILEREPLELAAKQGQMMAYPHHGFWQCMDTKRDRDGLEELWRLGNAPWSV